MGSGPPTPTFPTRRCPGPCRCRSSSSTTAASSAPSTPTSSWDRSAPPGSDLSALALNAQGLPRGGHHLDVGGGQLLLHQPEGLVEGEGGRVPDGRRLAQLS